MFNVRGRGGGGASTVNAGGSVASILSNPDFRTVTDTETATQATGKTITLPTPGLPMYLVGFATGSTGRYAIALPNGETIEVQCVPNMPTAIPLPSAFNTQTTKLVFSVITIDNAAAGNVIGVTIVYRPLKAQ